LKAAVVEDRPNVEIELELGFVRDQRRPATEKSAEETESKTSDVRHDSRGKREKRFRSSLTAAKGGRAPRLGRKRIDS
jgi:hypothetical protein